MWSQPDRHNIRLAEEIDKAKHLYEKFEQQKKEQTQTGSRSLLSLQNSLRHQVGNLEELQFLAVKQYALLQELEDLGASDKDGGINKTDYLQQRQNLIDRITHVEDQRLLLNIGDDIVDSLDAIEKKCRTLS